MYSDRASQRHTNQGRKNSSANSCSSAPSLASVGVLLFTRALFLSSCCPLLYGPGEKGKDLLVFFPVREVMLSRRAVVGDFCWGGVRHCFPSSSSEVEDTSSPMSIRSRLPSSTPFPSHRPQGNLPHSQHKHRSATQVA